MTPAARTQAVIDLLDEILDSSLPADNLMSRYFRDRRYIGSKDRQFIADRAYAAFRQMMRLQWWCRRLSVEADGRNLMLAYSLFHDRIALDDLEKNWDGSKFVPRSLMPSEKKFYIALGKENFIHPDMDEATQFECPEWAYDFLKEKFGADFAAEMKSTTEAAPLDLRANLLKATRDDVMARLKEENIDVAPTPYSPWGLRTRSRPALSRTETFQNGLVEIQDEGSQLIALLCDVAPGMQVLDLCAGAGGKTLALAAMMENKGRLVACDVSQGRLRRSKERLRRGDVNNAQTRLLDGEGNKWLKRSEKGFDRVLVDAPCTGTGTWRRNPDLRWRSPDLAELLKTQAELLDKGARCVKPGGKLIYGTCSFLDQENKNQIIAFLERHPDFKIVPAKNSLAFLSGDFMELTPLQHQTDGFFAAVLERIS